MTKRFAVVFIGVLIACGPAPEPRSPRQPPALEQLDPALLREAKEELQTVREAFLEWYFEAHPVRSTQLGVHEFDGSLPPMDRSGIQDRIDDVLDFLGQLDRIPPRLLDTEDQLDYGVIEFGLRAMLLDQEEIRIWAADPRLYMATVAEGLSSLVEREFAPVAERVASLRSRMAEAPAVLDAARSNVANPPRIWTELAIGEARALLGFVEADLPAALAAQRWDPAGDASFTAARESLAGALREHVEWLERDLLPRSAGDYRLGRYLFQRKLLYEEHVNLGVEELNRLNEQKIQEYQAWVARVAAEIDPARTPAAIMDSIARLHPSPARLLSTAREMMEEARAWVEASAIVELPPSRPIVRETPGWAAQGFASMDAPGPFDSPELAAYYNITNVDSAWTAEEQAQHLTYFNYPGLLGVTVHETYPGHHVQLAYARRYPSDARKVIQPRSLVEGWAHYAEQMVLDEGLRDGDPVARLAQLRRALQRHARWYAALHLHAFGETIEDVVPRFMEIAYFEEFPARREVIRATYDPTYLYYALGRLQILELREDYTEWLAEKDQQITLREFHDRLLSLGLPLTLARQALMPPEPQTARTQRRPGSPR